MSRSPFTSSCSTAEDLGLVLVSDLKISITPHHMASILTRGTKSDEVEILQYSTAGIDITVIDAVEILFNEWQKTRKLTRLRTHHNEHAF